MMIDVVDVMNVTGSTMNEVLSMSDEELWITRNAIAAWRNDVGGSLL